MSPAYMFQMMRALGRALQQLGSVYSVVTGCHDDSSR